MGNPFVHAELMTTDVGKAKEFYQKLFHWEFEDLPVGVAPTPDQTYTMINVGEGTGGGMLKNPMPGAKSSWMPYVRVNNVKEATDKAQTLGATVVKAVSEVKNMGLLSIIVDPTGAMLGLWQTTTKA